MATTEPCAECGVWDALGRHAGTCPRAIEIGLPRLADGEEPIDPIEDEREYAQAQAELPELNDAPGDIQRAPPDPLLTIVRERDMSAEQPSDASTVLWMAYHDDGTDFVDAVVFGAEIEALRYAVSSHWQVMPLELGRSLVDQARA